MRRKPGKKTAAAPSKRATLKEVAKAAGVSLASASYAINGTGSLGDATRRPAAVDGVLDRGPCRDRRRAQGFATPSGGRSRQ